MRKLLVIVIVLFGCVSQLYAGSKYIVLDPGLSIDSQIKSANYTYEIRDDFNLDGKVLNLPDACTLVFRGGSISNCSIVFRNTFLDGNVKIALCNKGFAKGKLLNEIIYTRWFKADLVQLLNSLIADNQHAVIKVATGTYTINEPIVICDVVGLELDFNGSVLYDQTQGDNAVLQCPNPMIWIRSSSNVSIGNFKYQVSDKRYFSRASTGILYLGTCSKDWNKDTYNITLSNISGKGSLIRKVKGGLSENIFICGLGNLYNIDVSNVQFDGDLLALCNFEYGLKPAEATYYKKKYNITLPDYYGLHPYNIRIRNVEGRNAPRCSGFIRLSSCYNVLVENCYGYNVNNFVYLYNGDMSINRANGSATIRNCVSYINSDYAGTDLAGISIFNAYTDPVSRIKHSVDIEHNMSYFIENCEFQGRASIPGYGIRVYGGDGNMVFNSVTVKNYSLAAKISGASSNTKVGGLSFNNCLFVNNNSSVEIYSVDNCLFSNCTFRNNSMHESNRIAENQIAVYSGVKGFTLRDCVFIENNKQNKASFIRFEQKSDVDAIISNCRFSGSKVTPVIAPESVSLSSCSID